MVKKKSLSNPEDVKKIMERISNIHCDSERKWGRMNAAQMCSHCDKVLQIPTGKIVLPKIHLFIRGIGAFSKFEMKMVNNGIPRNMPTFEQLITKENCNFETSREALLVTIEEFIRELEKENLITEHALFGKMTKYDWAFMEYKHLNHHLKQFNV